MPRVRPAHCWLHPVAAAARTAAASRTHPKEDGLRPPALTLLVMHGVPGAGPCLCGTPEDPAGAGRRTATATRPTGAALREGWFI